MTLTAEAARGLEICLLLALKGITVEVNLLHLVPLVLAGPSHDWCGRQVTRD